MNRLRTVTVQVRGMTISHHFFHVAWGIYSQKKASAERCLQVHSAVHGLAEAMRWHITPWVSQQHTLSSQYQHGQTGSTLSPHDISSDRQAAHSLLTISARTDRQRKGMIQRATEGQSSRQGEQTTSEVSLMLFSKYCRTNDICKHHWGTAKSQSCMEEARFPPANIPWIQTMSLHKSMTHPLRLANFSHTKVLHRPGESNGIATPISHSLTRLVLR